MIWGVTGCSGSGASTVCGCWARRGASVCSLDSIGHRFLEVPSVRSELERVLGIQGLASMSVRQVRERLRETAFRETGVLQGINSVLHPRLIRWASYSHHSLGSRRGIFVLDGALLFELGIERYADFTVTVSDSEERCLARVSKRDGLSDEAASGRWKNQMPVEEKRGRSHFVIQNSGSLEDLRSKAEYFYDKVIVQMEGD